MDELVISPLMELAILPFHFLTAAAVQFVLNWIALVPWRRTTGQHWTERTRILWPARVAARSNIWAISAASTLAQIVVWPATTALWPLYAAFALLGAIGGSYWFEKELFPWINFGEWLHHAVIGWTLRLSYWLVFVIAAWFMPRTFGWQCLAIGICVLAIHLAVNWGATVRLLHALKVLEPAPESLTSLVDTTSRRMHIAVAETYVFAGPLPLAYALPTTRNLLVAKRLLELAPAEEVAAIVAHEISHVGESKTTLSLRILGSLAFFPLIYAKPAVFQFGATGFVGLGLTVWFTASLAQKLSMIMEKRADSWAATITATEGTYANALERIYRESLLPAVNPSDRKTHPHLYDRMVSAGVTPTYPRPKAPENGLWTSFLVWVVVATLAAARFLRFGP